MTDLAAFQKVCCPFTFVYALVSFPLLSMSWDDRPCSFLQGLLPRQENIAFLVDLILQDQQGDLFDKLSSPRRGPFVCCGPKTQST